jgi:hypothetical protein
MNEEQTQTRSLRAAYAFGAAHGLEPEVTDIREMVIEWDSSNTSSLRRGYIALQNAASISALMLTTEAMICEIPEKKNSSPMPGGHDHGGMDF